MAVEINLVETGAFIWPSKFISSVLKYENKDVFNKKILKINISYYVGSLKKYFDAATRSADVVTHGKIFQINFEIFL